MWVSLGLWVSRNLWVSESLWVYLGLSVSLACPSFPCVLCLCVSTVSGFHGVLWSPPLLPKADEAFPDHLASIRPPCFVCVSVLLLMYLLSASSRKEAATLVASRARTINVLLKEL